MQAALAGIVENRYDWQSFVATLENSACKSSAQLSPSLRRPIND